VITIAHRLNSVADYDKIIVMSRGGVIEQGEPLELLEKQGHFAEMTRNTGKNADLIYKMAKKAY
jgi:ATP-binding cassette subfamily C (CFTR/MRP) protein 4